MQDFKNDIFLFVQSKKHFFYVNLINVLIKKDESEFSSDEVLSIIYTNLKYTLILMEYS